MSDMDLASVLKAEAARTSFAHVAVRLGVSEAAVRTYIFSGRLPKGETMLRALREFPELLDQLLDDIKCRV